MKLPETWRTRDGKLLRIRSMSNAHIAAASKMLRREGFISYREWRDLEPARLNGITHGVAGDEASYCAGDAWANEAWDEWMAKKHHGALDAFTMELAYRRRHGITIEEDGPSVMAERNGELG